MLTVSYSEFVADPAKFFDLAVRELEGHPFTGIGKPEALRCVPLWPRRLTQKDRVTYRVAQDVVEVLVLACLGHHDDK